MDQPDVPPSLSLIREADVEGIRDDSTTPRISSPRSSCAAATART